MGLLPARGGAARFDGVPLIGAAALSHRAAQAWAWCRKAGRSFRRLRSRKTWSRPRQRGFGEPRWTAARASTSSSRASRSGAPTWAIELSGGEQQMLAIGRALMTNPKLLILDEATEGLAPLIRAEIWACLARLKQDGQAILLVDKHLDALTRIADRHVVIEKGHVVWTGTSAELAADRRCARAICRCERGLTAADRRNPSWCAAPPYSLYRSRATPSPDDTGSEPSLVSEHGACAPSPPSGGEGAQTPY